MQPLNFGSLQNAVGTWAANKRAQNERLRQEQERKDILNEQRVYDEKMAQNERDRAKNDTTLKVAGITAAAKAQLPDAPPLKTAGQPRTRESLQGGLLGGMPGLTDPVAQESYLTSMQAAVKDAPTQQELADAEEERAATEHANYMKKIGSTVDYLQKWKDLRKPYYPPPPVKAITAITPDQRNELEGKRLSEQQARDMLARELAAVAGKDSGWPSHTPNSVTLTDAKGNPVTKSQDQLKQLIADSNARIALIDKQLGGSQSGGQGSASQGGGETNTEAMVAKFKVEFPDASDEEIRQIVEEELAR